MIAYFAIVVLYFPPSGNTKPPYSSLFACTAYGLLYPPSGKQDELPPSPRHLSTSTLVYTPPARGGAASLITY